MRYTRFARLNGHVVVLPNHLPEVPAGWRWLVSGETLRVGDQVWAMGAHMWFMLNSDSLGHCQQENRWHFWTIRQFREMHTLTLPKGVEEPDGFRPLYTDEAIQDDDFFYWVGTNTGWHSVWWCENKTPTTERVPRYRLDLGRVVRRLDG